MFQIQDMPVSIAQKLTIGCIYIDWETSKVIYNDGEPGDLTGHKDMI